MHGHRGAILSEPPAARRFGDFRLQLDSETLSRRGAVVPLGPRAFRVLRHLVLNAGRVVPQQELLDALWPGTFVEPDVLRTYVRDLRRALGDDPVAPRLIATCRGRGYRFVAEVEDERPGAGISGAGATPCFGRDRELASLARALDAASAGVPQLALIRGEAGIGKSTLLETFVARAENRVPCLVARGRRPRTDSVADGSRLRDVAGQWLQDAARTPRGPLGADRTAFDYVLNGWRAGERHLPAVEMAGLLDTFRGGPSFALVIDDVHCVGDDASALVDAVAESTRAGVLLVVALTSGEGLRHAPALTRRLSELCARRRCLEVQPGPLDLGAVEQFLDGWFPPEWVRSGLAPAVHRRTGGHPQLVSEVTEWLYRRRVEYAGAAELASAALDAVPEASRARLELQLDDLSVVHRRTVLAASVVGPSFTAASVASCLGGAERDTEEACADLARHGDVIREVSPARYPRRYEFVHGLCRESIYAAIPAEICAAWHRRTASWLIDAQENASGAGDVPTHLERGGEWQRAVEALCTGARSALRGACWSDAAHAVRRALDILHRQSAAERDPLRTALLESLGMIELMSGAPRLAMTTYEALASAAERSHSPEVQVRALLHLGYPASLVSAPQALRAVEQAHAVLESVTDPVAQDRAAMRSAFLRVWSGRWSATERDRFRRALRGLQERERGEIAAFHLADYSYLQWLSSDYHEGRRSAEFALSTLKEGTDVLQLLNAQLFLAWQLLFLGEWHDALTALDAAEATAERHAYEPRAKAIPLFRAWLSLHAGDFAGARESCRRALPYYLEHSEVGAGLRICLILSGAAEAEGGSARRALDVFGMAETQMRQRPMNMDWYWRMQLALGRTEVALRQRRTALARQCADELLSLASATAERTWQALAWNASSRVALVANDPQRADSDIETALRLIRTYELPLAGWRVYRTAATTRAVQGRHAAAEALLLQGRHAALKVAEGLDECSALRATFLRRATAPLALPC